MSGAAAHAAGLDRVTRRRYLLPMTDAPEPIPFVKSFDFAYGRADRVSPLVRRVIAENPGPFTYTGSGTYIIGPDEGPLAIIDPGPDLPAHLDALKAAIGEARVSHILVTHAHLDHCGGARSLAESVGAPIYAITEESAPASHDEAPALEEGVDLGFKPDHPLKDGDLVEGEGWTIEAVHTPGHLSGHLCFALREEKALFTGDHMMGWATTVIIPPDGDMGDYFDSLDKCLARDDEIYYPTHGAPISEPRRFTRAVKAHRRMRDGQILKQIEAGRTRIPDMVKAMYAEVDPRLHPAASLSVLAHIVRLERIGDIACDGPARMDATYRLA